MNEVLKVALPGLISSALPTLMVLVGILLNRNDINRLDARISSWEIGLRGEIAAVRGEVAAVRAEVAGAENRLLIEIRAMRSDMLDARRDAQVEAVKRMADHHSHDLRIARLERQA